MEAVAVEAVDVRYDEIKAAVVAGTLAPSSRAILATFGGRGVKVQGYLHRLAAEGITVRKGQSWVLNGSAVA